jgi:hypothetical protein
MKTALGAAVLAATAISGLSLAANRATPVAAPADTPRVAAGVRQEPGYPFAKYDGRFTFVRVRFEPSLSQYGRRGRGGREPAWHHDYPTSDINLTKIVAEVTDLLSLT